MKLHHILLAALLGLTGCTSVVMNSNKIVVIKTRWLGVSVGENPATQMPEIKLGWGSVVYQMIPTSTNGPVYAPRYVDAFDLGQAINPFATKIIENTAIGDTAVGENGAGGAILPKLHAPQPLHSTNEVPRLRSPKDSQ